MIHYICTKITRGLSLGHLQPGHRPVLLSEESPVLEPRPHEARDVEPVEHSSPGTSPKRNQHPHERLQSEDDKSLLETCVETVLPSCKEMVVLPSGPAGCSWPRCRREPRRRPPSCARQCCSSRQQRRCWRGRALEGTHLPESEFPVVHQNRSNVLP